ncbi:DAK2 domain-containing protein [Streptomyces chiangmaiensis]
MAQVPQPLDALAVRTWCGLALQALGRAREEIDAINVYPVADGDTGTNLYLTVESAAAAVEAVFAGYEAGGAQRPTLADAVRAMAHGALIGARGNSGTILAQLLRGMAQVLAADGETAHTDEQGLRLALRRAADSARDAVAHPVEGTVLSVATAAADAVTGVEDDCGGVARAAYEGARTALAATPGQLAVLERAGVVDAGGRGLVTVLAALVETFTGEAPRIPEGSGRLVHQRVDDGTRAVPENCADVPDAQGGPAYEVIYLLEADDAAVARLRQRLDALGNSLVVVGGDGLWNVHVHVDDAGAAVEAGIEAGRPHRIRITHFAAGDVHTARTGRPPRERVQRAVVAVVPGEGLAALYREAGATTVLARAGEPLASGELVEGIRRAHAREVVLLPNDADLRHTAAAAAEQARTEGSAWR